jgi:hypothetical protein
MRKRLAPARGKGNPKFGRENKSVRARAGLRNAKSETGFPISLSGKNLLVFKGGPDVQ